MASLSSILSKHLILMIFHCLNAEQVLDKLNEDFDFDGLPGVTYEFKIEVYSGREQCFYQKIANEATLHLSFEVLRGSDKLVDVVIWDPNNNQVDAKHSVTSGYFENKITFEGIYTICIDNFVSRNMYGSKLIYFYMMTYIMSDWYQYQKEIESVSSTVTNFTRTVTSVQNSIEAVKQHQTHIRMNVVKDNYFIRGNNDYISWWSISQILIIVCTSGFQVFCVRRLFRIPHISGKPSS
ncbi:transmembrane emp24 domain-containing protein A-like [Mytilus galloprovincialis]|uniref:transmembrane emp24 domain-containing protein A-like n=1 Tax=Mytilus galloprovincialis TaxID=29158 RepID=UPI003F7BEB0E